MTSSPLMPAGTIATRIWPYAARSIERLITVAFDELDKAGRAWRPDTPDANSVLTLVNHMISNAEDNLLGTVVGANVTYDRQADFDTPETDPAAIRARWSRVRAAFEVTLPRLDDAHMFAGVTHPRRGTVTRFDVLVVVTRHAAEHLAHAELTRDLYRARAADRDRTAR